MIKPTFRQLQVFLTVTQKGNFTQASQVLHLSQPAVSIQVKQLEEQVGLKLFERKGRKLMLTQAGKVLLQSSHKIHDNLQELNQNIEDLKGLKTGHLELTVVSTANAFSTKLLAKFLESYPRVTFSLNVSNRRDIIKQMSESYLELAIMGLPPERLNVEAKVIMENPLVIVANKEHVLAGQKNITLDRLVAESFVVREQGSGTRYVLTALFEDQGITFEPRLAFSAAEAIKDAVHAGLGLALVSYHTISSDLENKNMVVLDVLGTPVNRHWHLVSPRDQEMSPIAKRFHDFVLEQAKSL